MSLQVRMHLCKLSFYSAQVHCKLFSVSGFTLKVHFKGLCLYTICKMGYSKRYLCVYVFVVETTLVSHYVVSKRREN